MSILAISTKTAATTLAIVLLTSASFAAEAVVELPNGIKGTLATPDTGAAGPAVVTLHGFGSSRDEVGGLLRSGEPKEEVRLQTAMAAAGRAAAMTQAASEGGAVSLGKQQRDDNGRR